MNNYVPDDVHAFNEQYRDVEHRYNPAVVTLRKIEPAAGAIASLEFKVSPCGAAAAGEHPEIYVINNDTNTEEKIREITGWVHILPGFPATRPVVCFSSKKPLKHINVFKGGRMCVGDDPQTSLTILMDNVIGACIYNPNPFVANYDSPANGDAVEWQKEKELSGEFPLIDPAKIFNKTARSLPQPVVRKASAPRRNGTLPPVVVHR